MAGAIRKLNFKNIDFEFSKSFWFDAYTCAGQLSMTFSLISNNYHENDVDFDIVPKLLSKSIKEKLEAEAINLNFIPKVGILPI